MQAPHWREWWGEPQSELAQIRAMVEGEDSTRPFLFSLDGRVVGYLQCWFLSDPENAFLREQDPLFATLPPESVGLDLSIGEASDLSCGIGSAALRAFCSRLRREGRRSILIDPSRRNARAIRAYEKAGFRRLADFPGFEPDSIIMRLRDGDGNGEAQASAKGEGGVRHD